MSRKIEIIINKSEITAGTRGSSLGPKAIMTASRNMGKTFFGDHPMHELKERNSALDKPANTPFAKQIETYQLVFQDVANTTKSVLENGSLPLVIAGDHGSAAGTIAGIKTAYPDKRLGVVWIDAHADIHSPYTTPSGNMHGMPVALSLADDNKESQRNTPDELTVEIWENMKQFGNISPKIAPEDIIYIAVRDTEEQEDAVIARRNIRNFTVADVRFKGASAIVKQTLEQLSDCDILYISFDVDSMDPVLTSYGTGTPVEDGISPEEARQMLLLFAAEPKTICMEFVEINPCLDNKTNKMAEIAFSLIEASANTLKNTDNGKQD